MGTVTTGMPQLSDQRRRRLDAFALYVSPLPWFNIDILHKLYLNVFLHCTEGHVNSHEERIITCADLIHSPEVRRLANNVFAFHPETQGRLRIDLLQDNRHAAKRIGYFMLAYIQVCRQHCLSPKYVEAFRIEANSILDPTAEADRIVRNAIQKYNRTRNSPGKFNGVEYYLQMLESKSSGTKQKGSDILRGLAQLNENITAIPDGLKDILRPREQDAKGTFPLKLSKEINAALRKHFADSAKTQIKRQLHALIIGINEYPQSPLRAPVMDATRFQNLILSGQIEGVEYNIRKLTDGKARRQDILDALRQIEEQIQAEDTFLFYFSGHGSREIFGSSLPPGVLSSTNTNSLSIMLCADSLIEDEQVPGLAIEEVEFLLGNFPQCKCVLILDTEFPDGKPGDGFPSRNPDQYVWKDFPDERIGDFEVNGIIIYGTGKGQVSYESSEFGGYFTNGLCDALDKSHNSISYAQLFEGYSAMQLPISETITQTPYYEVRGNFNPKELFLENFLTTHSEDVLARIHKCNEGGGIELDFSQLQLGSIPMQVFQISSLETLDLSNNNISVIPAEIGQLTNLEVLVANNNPISFIHEDVGKLENLRAVILNQCELSKFPYGLLNAKNLNNLQLEGNEIKWIPVAIKDMDKLEQLDVRNNPIMNLPSEMRSFSASELNSFFSNWGEQVTLEGRPFVYLFGIDYDEKYRNIPLEMDELHSQLEDAGIECLDLYNPDSLELFAALYQYQDTSIIHIATYLINDLKDPQGNRKHLSDEDVVEMFRCIRPERFSTNLLLLNCCETEPLILKLLQDTFNLAIGMKGMVSDDLAFEFAKEFYHELLDSQPFEIAFENTKKKFIS